MNDKIGKWSLYGTIGGIVGVGILITIINDGIISLVGDFIPVIIGVSALLVILFIISKLPEKWVTFLYSATFLGFVYIIERSWTFTIIIAVLLILYALAAKKIKDKSVAKKLNVIFVIVFFIAFAFH